MKYETPYLETDRLILKRGTKEDFIKVYEYDFTKLRDIAGEFEFVKNDPKKIEGFKTYADEDNVLDWIMYLKDGTPIGDIVADRIQKDINAIELAFNLHPSFWHKGYMTEGVIKVMEYLYSIGFDNIICGYDEGNIKSKGLNEKLGFTLYEVKENAWVKNGISIASYSSIMSKEEFKNKYGLNLKKEIK